MGKNPCYTWSRNCPRSWLGRRNGGVAFTTSNAESSFFDSYSRLADLGLIDWDAVAARDWAAPKLKERKQAEFL
ncbi:MAG: DUF4433 domain-containing protein, partial [Planctomycetes bacterium]|nr:DUF4433 domain-containing protein [Planctomycetota bacterium]